MAIQERVVKEEDIKQYVTDELGSLMMSAQINAFDVKGKKVEVVEALDKISVIFADIKESSVIATIVFQLLISTLMSLKDASTPKKGQTIN